MGSCPAFRRSLLSGVFAAALVRTAYAQAPIQIPASPNTYGPDGPWNAVRAYYGSHQLDLFPGGWGFAWARNQTYCDDVEVCAYEEAGFYANSSQPLDVAPPESYSGTLYGDSFSLSPGGPLLSRNSTIFSTSAWSDVYPNGLPVNHSCGLLDVGPGREPMSLPASLWLDGKIQSASVSYHIGSVKPHIPPAVYYGGYDASRVVERPITVDISVLGGLATKLFDISILTLGGVNPVISNTTGLLKLNNATINAEGGLDNVYMTAAHPFMELPASVCNALASALPVTFDGDLSLYLWNTNSPLYAKLMSSPIFLAFDFGGQDPIKVPLSLLSLTLESPFPNAPVTYFPCSPAFTSQGTPGYELGRSFMQAVTIGVNWYEHNDGPARFFIAQAPGPDFDPPHPVAIVGDSMNPSVKPGNPTWEQSWASYWNLDSGTRGSSGLSGGAKAGIGVGVALGVLLLVAVVGFVFWRRRQRRQSKRHSKTPGLDSTSYSYFPQNKGPHFLEMEGYDSHTELYGDTLRAELDHRDQRATELYGDTLRWELDYRNHRTTELE